MQFNTKTEMHRSDIDTTKIQLCCKKKLSTFWSVIINNENVELLFLFDGAELFEMGISSPDQCR